MPVRFNIPPVTRALLGLTVAISFIYNVARYSHPPAGNDVFTGSTRPLVPYLALVPAYVIYYPWTLITTVFVEQNILTLVVNGAALYFGGRYFERAWGSRAFLVALLITSLVPNVLAVPLYITWAAVSGQPARAMIPITGGITLQAAFLVACKQIVPEHTVSIYKGMVKLRVKHFPAIFLAVNTISGLVLGTTTALVLSWLGFVTTWVYLRFYKRQPDLSSTSTDSGGIKGDASETFAFATFFPEVVQPPIASGCDKIFNVLCTLKLCTPFSDEAVAISNEHAAHREDGGLPEFVKQSRGLKGMSKREEAERRRALALRALDQRLSAATSSRPAETSAATLSEPNDQEAVGQTDYKPDGN
ncbi:hypothetical protein DV737_g5313, partial [Chaetothyriales sp. CBS 132003]